MNRKVYADQLSSSLIPNNLIKNKTLQPQDSNYPLSNCFLDNNNSTRINITNSYVFLDLQFYNKQNICGIYIQLTESKLFDAFLYASDDGENYHLIKSVVFGSRKNSSEFSYSEDKQIGRSNYYNTNSAFLNFGNTEYYHYYRFVFGKSATDNFYVKRIKFFRNVIAPIYDFSLLENANETNGFFSYRYIYNVSYDNCAKFDGYSYIYFQPYPVNSMNDISFSLDFNPTYSEYNSTYYLIRCNDLHLCLLTKPYTDEGTAPNTKRVLITLQFKQQTGSTYGNTYNIVEYTKDILESEESTWYGLWHHLSVSYNKNKMIMCIDGQLISQQICGNNYDYSSPYLSFGNDGSGSYYFNGSMKNIKFYCVSLSNQQLKKI